MLPDPRDPKYLRFLETYNYEAYRRDSRIGPRRAFELQEKKRLMSDTTGSI